MPPISRGTVLPLPSGRLEVLASRSRDRASNRAKLVSRRRWANATVIRLERGQAEQGSDLANTNAERFGSGLAVVAA
jgi:hypothetical protein